MNPKPTPKPPVAPVEPSAVNATGSSVGASTEMSVGSSPARPVDEVSADLGLGGPVDARQKIADALRPLVDRAGEAILKVFGDNSLRGDGPKNEEAPHKGWDGFVPYTEGGRTVSVGYFATGLDENGKGGNVGPVRFALDMLTRQREAYAITLLECEQPLFEKVAKFIGQKPGEWKPKDYVEDVLNAIYREGEKSEAKASKAEALREEVVQQCEDSQLCDEDDRIDIEVRAFIYAPDNHRNKLGDGKWEIQVFGRVGHGSYSMMTNQPKQDEAIGGETSLGVDPLLESSEQIAAKVKPAVQKTLAWIRGAEIVVGKTDGQGGVLYAVTVEEAENCIREIEKKDPKGVARGDYYIDVPEHLQGRPDAQADTAYFDAATKGKLIHNRFTGETYDPSVLLEDWKERGKPVRMFTDMLTKEGGFSDIHLVDPK